MSKQTAPTLLVHGGKDDLILPEQSMKMDAALAAANVPHRLLVIDDATHGNVEHKPASMPAVVAWFEERLAAAKGKVGSAENVNSAPVLPHQNATSENAN